MSAQSLVGMPVGVEKVDQEDVSPMMPYSKTRGHRAGGAGSENEALNIEAAVTDGQCSMAKVAPLLGKVEGTRWAYRVRQVLRWYLHGANGVDAGGKRPPALMSAKVADELRFVRTTMVAVRVVLDRCTAVSREPKRCRYAEYIIPSRCRSMDR